MKKIFEQRSWFFIFIYIFGYMYHSSAYGANACIGINMDVCRNSASPIDAAKALDSAECGRVLETLQACQRYEDSLFLLSDNRIALKPQQQYFYGASFFALYSRSQSAALKCEFGTRAKGALETYLVDVQDVGKRTGLYGSASEMRYIYSATKMYNTLKDMKGCIESVHSAQSLKRFVEGFSSQRLKNALFGIKENDVLDTAGTDFWASFQAIVKLLVQGASEVESGLGMKATEAETSLYYYGKTKESLQGIVSLTEVSGVLSISFDPIDQIYQNKWDTVRVPLMGPEGMVTKVTAAIGKIDAPTFDAARSRLIDKARDTERRLAWNTDYLSKNFNNDASLIKQLSSASTSTVAVLRGIQGKYAGIRGCTTQPQPWYCKQ